MPPLKDDSVTKEQLYDKVRVLYPGFTPNGLLRFSSLLGPGRPSTLPKIWEGCVKPTKHLPKSANSPRKDFSDDWTFDFGPSATPDMLDDQDNEFMAPVDIGRGRAVGGAVNSGRGMSVQEFEEWRYGPSRYWYDLYNAPQDGREYNYGYKLRVCV